MRGKVERHVRFSTLADDFAFAPAVLLNHRGQREKGRLKVWDELIESQT